MPDILDLPGSYDAWQSYTNSLLANRVTLVPIHDSNPVENVEALHVHQEALSGEPIALIPSSDTIKAGGAIVILCTTQTILAPLY